MIKIKESYDVPAKLKKEIKEFVKPREINSACKKRGIELAAQAKEEIIKRRQAGAGEAYQAAKEGAVYLRNKARGRVSVIIEASDWKRIFGKKGKNVN